MAEGEQAAYKDFQVWQKSMEFARRVIQLVDELDTPRKHYRLLEQLEAAVTSVPMNIADIVPATYWKGRAKAEN